jgi:hypothetical protein
MFERRRAIGRPAEAAAAEPIAPVAAAAGPIAAPGGPIAAAAPADPPSGQIVVDSPDQVVAKVRDRLTAFVSQGAGLPTPSVAVLQVSDRTLGIGNSRGLQAVGPFSTVELYGGRIDCVVRFKVWGTDAPSADAEMTALQGRLFGGRADLLDAGFVQFEGVAGTLPTEDGNAWSRTADYHALVEYHLAPVPSADSLIAAIPIEVEQQLDGTVVGETTTETDDIARWDQLVAPALVVHGRRTVDRLVVAAFLPAPPPNGAVQLVRSHDGATGAPQDFATLAEFLAAVCDPAAPERHARFSFASLPDFVAACQANGEMQLGDWDQDAVPDEYVVGQLAFEPPIPLPAAPDRFQVVPQTSPLDHVGVVYLRASGTLG